MKTAVTILAACALAGAIASCGGGSSGLPRPGPVADAALHAAASPVPTQTPPPKSAYLPDTWKSIHAFQPFDDFNNKYIIPASQAAADGALYDAVWGSNSGQMVAAWETNHPKIRTSLYITSGTDALTAQFGNLGHDITWWQANHPDWVLYECDQTTVAYVQGIPQIPLDLSNPDVVSYLLNLLGTYAETNGYSALSFDFVELNNPTGGQHGGTRGCGVKTTGGWVQKYSGNQTDPAYATAIMNWIASAHTYVHSLARPLALWGNHVPGNAAPGDPTEIQLLSNLDVVHDETGFARYSNFSNDNQFNNVVYWAKYIQAQGKGMLVSALWHDATISNAELEYSIAGYLMEKEQAADLDTVPYGTYGQEHYFPAYHSAVGSPCAEMYGGPSYQGLGEFVYYRKYSKALAVFNTKLSASYTVTLPQATYTDAVSGATVTSPLTVAPHGGYVLLVANGCR